MIRRYLTTPVSSPDIRKSPEAARLSLIAGFIRRPHTGDAGFACRAVAFSKKTRSFDAAGAHSLASARVLHHASRVLSNFDDAQFQTDPLAGRGTRFVFGGDLLY